MTLNVDDVKQNLSNTVEVDIETLEVITILASELLQYCEVEHGNIVINRKNDAPIVVNKMKIETDIKAIHESLTYVDDDIAPINAELNIKFCDY